jgi:hypothetical protein
MRKRGGGNTGSRQLDREDLEEILRVEMDRATELADANNNYYIELMANRLPMDEFRAAVLKHGEGFTHEEEEIALRLAYFDNYDFSHLDLEKLKKYIQVQKKLNRRKQIMLDSHRPIAELIAMRNKEQLKTQLTDRLKDRHKATVVQEELGKKLPNTDVDKSGILANVLGFAGIAPAPKGVNLPDVPLPVGPRKEDGTFGGKTRRKRRKHRKTHKR